MNKVNASFFANAMIEKHNLEGWSFKFNYRSKNRLGCCKYNEKVIELSAWCLDGGVADGKVEDTIRHEIAHAIAGYHAGHGPLWKAACKLTGANPNRVAGKDVVINAPKAKYKVVCEACDKIAGERHRRSNLSRYQSVCCRSKLIYKLN